ncbi:hypothetical protein BKA58DRAFT_466928 [Alternaria rosae]|uniref:uncharacterized protein n=1 Tax=Alternaria rosae TaxID=1187941 RepID=UPI001E8D6251|nr:uncharacterized protein BKA58DRAFT_466928 [Alternaria rosae]KAH6875070.1 hypothetical protein BKA58DRAFT_466928 [Alternaria rosae]
MVLECLRRRCDTQPYGVEQLANWNWHEAEYHQGHHCDFTDDGNGYNRIGVALTALELDAKPATDGRKNKGYSVEHQDSEEEYENGDQVPVNDQVRAVRQDTYTATGGHYRFAINEEQGALFFQSLGTPRHAATHDWAHTPRSNELPRLQFAPDILAAYWSRTPHPKGLKYYFANNVSNEETLPLINKIIEESGYDRIPEWPGVRVSADSEEGAVLVGSSIGATLAYILL